MEEEDVSESEVAGELGMELTHSPTLSRVRPAGKLSCEGRKADKRVSEWLLFTLLGQHEMKDLTHSCFFGRDHNCHK